MAMTSSPRPKAKPLSMKRPMKRPPDLGMSKEESDAMQRMLDSAARSDEGTGKMKSGGKVISEYGGKEKYASKKAMMRHERAESPAKERAEKMKSGGAVRGTGAAIRGKGFSGCY